MSGGGWFDRAVETPLRRPRATLLVAALVTLVAVLLWPFVRFEPDVSQVLPKDHPHVRIAELLDDRARPARTLWLLVRGDELERTVPAFAATLRDAPGVVDVVTTRAELFRDVVARFEAAPLWQLDADQRDALAQRLSEGGVRAAVEDLLLDLADDPVAARELALRDPLGVRWILSRDERFLALGFAPDRDLLVLADPAAGGQERALVQLRGAVDAYDAEFATALCDRVDAALAAHGLAAEVFGGYVVARADQARIRADFERASTWSVLAIALYLCWVMRGVRLPLLVQLPAMLSIAWAIPFGSLLFGALPTVAVAAVAVLCGLGVDFAIHYAARYRRARLGLAHDEAVRRVQRTTVPELLIDMATTAVTFLAIGLGAGGGGLRAFGLLLALGLVSSVLFTVFALPVLLRFAGDRRDPERSLLAGLADRWLARPASRPVAWAALALALGGVAWVLHGGIPLSAQPETLRPKDDPVAAARRSIEAQVGFATVPVLLLWPEARDASPLLGGLTDLREAGAVRFWTGLEPFDTAAGRAAVAAARARMDGFVGRAVAALDEAGLDPAAFRPALDELAARIAADPRPSDAAMPLEHAGEPHRVVTVWPAERVGLDRFDAFEAGLHGVLPSAGDRAALVVHAGATVTRALEEMLRRDLERACLVAALLAVLMVTWWLRSLPAGLLALVPSVLGLVATLVLLRLLELPLSMISFVAVPFVLGIGVDEGVHLVGHYRHEGEPGAATGATGVGIVRTSFGTVLGFSALLLADSPGLAVLGGLVAFGSTACMLSCLFVLAPLLARRALGGR